eukprot:jgi/Orpsp1_1/1191058/evm.model.d7180000083222.1
MKDINGEYPIVTAFYNDNITAFKYLIEHGANCNTININDISLLSLAILKKSVDLVKYLLGRPDIEVNRKDINGNTPLAVAIQQQNPDIIKLILDYGMKNNIDLKVNEKDGNGNYPLMSIIEQNDIDNFIFL